MKIFDREYLCGRQWHQPQ